MTLKSFLKCVLPTSAFLSVSLGASANGVFNGPVTEGLLAAQENGRELELGTFLTRHRDCAINTLKDVYRQVYPQYRGELVSFNNETPIEANESSLDFYYAESNGVKYIYGFYFLSPKDSGIDLSVPPQLVVSLNGTSFFGAPPAGQITSGSLVVTRFETNPDVNLLSSFPGFLFDVERRVDGFDALGRPVNVRNVLTNLRLDPNADLGTRIGFVNSETRQPTVVTWNARAFVSCISNGLPVAAL